MSCPCPFNGSTQEGSQTKKELKVAKKSIGLSRALLTLCFLICKMGIVLPAHLLISLSTDRKTKMTVSYYVQLGYILMEGDGGHLVGQCRAAGRVQNQCVSWALSPPGGFAVNFPETWAFLGFLSWKLELKIWAGDF